MLDEWLDAAQRRIGPLDRAIFALRIAGQERRSREPLVEPLGAHDVLACVLDDLCDELAAGRPGARAMVETLVRRCLILLLRRCSGRPSWLAGLEDARLGRAVGAMQACPAGTFTLSTLAEEAGMSRSVFAARFTSVLGEPPMDFLKALRLGRAAELLTRTDLPVKTVASEVGYSSRSSFTTRSTIR